MMLMERVRPLAFFVYGRVVFNKVSRLPEVRCLMGYCNRAPRADTLTLSHVMRGPTENWRVIRWEELGDLPKE